MVPSSGPQAAELVLATRILGPAAVAEVARIPPRSQSVEASAFVAPVQLSAVAQVVAGGMSLRRTPEAGAAGRSQNQSAAVAWPSAGDQQMDSASAAGH